MKKLFLNAIAVSMSVMFAHAGDIKANLSGGDFVSKNNQTAVVANEMRVEFKGLPAGQYTVEVEAAELRFVREGKRIFNITCGDVGIASNLDIIKQSGDKNKSVTVKAKVEHKGDSLRGPLTVLFSGVTNNAIFSGIKVLDAAGTMVADATADKFKAEVDAFGSPIPVIAGPEKWKDESLTPAERAADLVSRLSLNEKCRQIQMAAPAIPRLGIPAYDWWNECLHGVARAGKATVFPQAIAAAATWNSDLWHQAAQAMSVEARAKHHDAARKNGGSTKRYFGLDMWSPNVNIFRDPRWGRGQETYGEDPYLSGRMGVAFVKGLQGDDPKYIKVIATPKHFAVHSGPEAERHRFDANCSDQDLWETYLPQFEACFVEGKAHSIMGAYNRFRGESCSSSKFLLIDILRGKWGFNGYSVSDVDSVEDIYTTHKIKKDAAEASAHAVKNGMDLNSGSTYAAMPRAVERGLVSAADVDIAVKRCMEARIRLGMFDKDVPYSLIPMEKVTCKEHDELSLKVARESIVLLKNDKGLLPLKKTGTVAVIGPNADDTNVKEDGLMVGNYSGTPPHLTTILGGIRKKFADAGNVLYAKGCEIKNGKPEQAAEAMAAAKKADVVIMVMGINPEIEGEEGAGDGDRKTLDLFPDQEKLMKEICGLGKPVVLVLMGGSALAVNWAQENVPAILDAWYPGQNGGDAVADVIFGDYNPAGRLPVTFYKSVKDLPDFSSYDMKDRTYRYYKGEPLYAFGYGLSYTTFKYGKMTIAEGKDGIRTVSIDVSNTGKIAGDEVVQLYISRKDAPAEERLPMRSLKGFKRTNIEPGSTKTVTFKLTPFQFALVRKDGVRSIEPGEYLISVGGSQKAESSDTVRIKDRVENPAYAHAEPEVK